MGKSRVGANRRRKITAGRVSRSKKIHGLYYKNAKTLLTMLGVFLVIGAAVWGGKYGIRRLHISDALSSVKSIELSGTNHVSHDDALRQVEKLTVGGFSRTSAAAIQAGLCANPWIDNVKIVRTLGGKLVVKVTERAPIALVNSGAVYQVDAKGKLIPLSGGSSSDLPLLSGLRDTLCADGARMLDSVSCRRLNAIAAVLKASDAVREMPVSQIEFCPHGVLRVAFQGSPIVVDLDEKDMAERLARLEDLQNVFQHDTAPAHIDLRYRNLAFITHGEKTATGKNMHAVAD